MARITWPDSGDRMRAVIALLALAAATPGVAQITVAGPVVNGHHHFNAGDIALHQRFWVDTLGGRAATFASGTAMVIFPEALIFMRDQDPTGGMIGSSVNHVGLSVNNLRAMVDKLEAAGYTMITQSERPGNLEVVDDIAVVPGTGPVSGLAYVQGPDGIKVELVEMKAQTLPILSHHIHFFGEDPAAMRAWYIANFGAVERPGATNGILSADLPGLGLSFSQASTAQAPTTGRVLDHIGFEIEGLEAFTAGLAARGIELAVPFRRIDDIGLSIAFVVDPWGTRIELTEGLREVR
jgi:catechol 2,3-dioxygenase-like lactoylglutathione lyase family enzyme